MRRAGFAASAVGGALRSRWTASASAGLPSACSKCTIARWSAPSSTQRSSCRVRVSRSLSSAGSSFYSSSVDRRFLSGWSQPPPAAPPAASAASASAAAEQELENAVQKLAAEAFPKLEDPPVLVSASFGDPRDKRAQEYTKVTMRPVLIKGALQYQSTYHCPTRVIVKNYPPAEAPGVLRNMLSSVFKQAQVFTASADFHFLSNPRTGKTSLTRKKPSKAPEGPGPSPARPGLSVGLQHDRKKEYVLREGEAVPFLVHLGVMTAEGRVVKAKYDKFRQINRYLEFVRDVVPVLQRSAQDRPIRIIDFGCGLSYLTFALFHYLSGVLGLDVRVEGVDLKRDVIASCEELSKALGSWPRLRFHHGDIRSYDAASDPVDMVVSLHACDTATDEALRQAVGWGAAAVFAVPCCQHEVMRQVASEPLQALLRHGILKERFAALATDAARAALLTAAGYSTQVLEFIETEHTPKNLLIRATKGSGPAEQARAAREYRALAAALAIRPATEAALGPFLPPERGAPPPADADGV